MSNLDSNMIIINASQVPGQVTFSNYEEIKSYLEQGLSVYKTTQYTTDNIEDAKKDLDELKSIKKKLTDKKKEIENAYTEPYVDVKEKLDELINLVKEPFDIIDKFIKNYEKENKRIEIMEYARTKGAELGEYANKVVDSNAFFNDKWLNKTTSMKKIREAIDEKIDSAKKEISAIKEVTNENKDIALTHYFQNLDMDSTKEFIKSVNESNVDKASEDFQDDSPVGYKVLKITATELQMLQIVTYLDIMDVEYDELEDGMPKHMEEVKSTDFNEFVAFDIEHTGTYGVAKGDLESEIMEIGAVRVVDGQIVDKFSSLANPGRDIVPRISRITGINNDMVKDEAPITEVVKEFRDFVGDSILLGHNIKACDIPHIVKAAKKAGITFNNQYFDTRDYAKQFKEKYNLDNIKLETLSKYFGIEHDNAHRAWADAEANAKVFLAMKNDN
ncbi:MAG: DUF1351 domain-containing protein [Lachnospiraceae bacterium]|nr:DUF1351 domain-containing protein [Lachnospiraceae bacterium]